MKIKTRLRESGKFFLKSGASIALALFLILSLFTVKGTAPALAVLAQGDAVTDPTAILRNALPIDNKPIRQVQQSIEDIAKHLRAKRWSPIKKDVKDANYALSTKSKAILDSVPEASKSQGEELIEKLKTGVAALDTAVEAKDKEAVWSTRRELLNHITALEELMVVGFPFNVPPEYANLPQLRGRATIEMQTTKGDLTIVVDGYSAPINGGNFVDLVQRGFYDGLPFIRSEDNFVVQTGDPVGAEEGFIDTNPNGGSSQFFFFKFDNELTPPGFNLMDGRYSVFGYLVEGKEVLEELTDQDKIISVKVVYGLNNLVQPS